MTSLKLLYSANLDPRVNMIGQRCCIASCSYKGINSDSRPYSELHDKLAAAAHPIIKMAIDLTFVSNNYYIVPLIIFFTFTMFTGFIIVRRIWKGQQYKKLVDETYGRFHETEVIVADPHPVRPVSGLAEEMERNAEDLTAAEQAV